MSIHGKPAKEPWSCIRDSGNASDTRFQELVRNHMTQDPDFSTALVRENTDTTPTPLTMRDALRLIWQAAKYPILGNEDWRVGERMDAEALERAATAVQGPDDLPEFAAWISALRDPKLPDDERDDILSAIYDVFDPDRD
jgi:hypothetical protein